MTRNNGTTPGLNTPIRPSKGHEPTPTALHELARQFDHQGYALKRSRSLGARSFALKATLTFGGTKSSGLW